MSSKNISYSSFLMRLSILALPLLLILSTFFLIDPFGIVYRFNGKEPSLIGPSSDFVVVENYLRTFSSRHYSSYTFGNSKSLAFLPKDWFWHISDSNIYQFGAPGESVNNIYNKLKLIESKKQEIRNALIMLDFQILNNYNNSDKNLQGPTYVHHPLSTNGSWLDFYGTYLKSYLNNFAFMNIIDYSIFKTYRPNMRFFFKDPKLQSTNEEEAYKSKITGITTNDTATYMSHDSMALIRQMLYAQNKAFRVKNENYDELMLIKNILSEHRANYKIILVPSFDQVKFPQDDLAKLQQIFGSDKVYDFTGKNKYTDKLSNYFETSHFKPYIGREILDSIYSK